MRQGGQALVRTPRLPTHTPPAAAESGIEFAPSGLARLVQPDSWAGSSTIRTVADMILASGATHFSSFQYETMYAGFVAAAQGADVVVGSGM